jgi:hypothetical protein
MGLAALDSSPVPNMGHLVWVECQWRQERLKAIEVNVHLWEKSVVVAQFLSQFFPFTQTVGSVINGWQKSTLNNSCVIEDFSQQSVCAVVIHTKMVEHTPVLTKAPNQRLPIVIPPICVR